jgi:dimethylglycine dehydrogenase
VKALGGQMAPYNGWERAEWYAQPGDDTSWESTQTWKREGPWQKRVSEECAAVRDGVGVLDLPGFTRLLVKGPGARAHVAALAASRLPKPGRIGLVYFSDDKGRIVTEMSCMVHSDEAVGLITAAVAQWHDRDVIAKGLPEGCVIEDHSEEVNCFIVTGPKARDLLAPITTADLALPWLTVQEGVKVAGRACALIRVSFAGELGWEIHAARTDAPAIYDALLAGGAKPFGMKALNSLRIEKGYRAWKGDLSTDYTLLQGGLDRFIDWDHDFPGRTALLAEKQRGVTKRFVSLELGPCEFDAPYMSTVWSGDQVVGEVTSSAMGYRTGKPLALATVRVDKIAEGTALEVEIFGERVPARVLADGPAWDAKNERIRA